MAVRYSSKLEDPQPDDYDDFFADEPRGGKGPRDPDQASPGEFGLPEGFDHEDFDRMSPEEADQEATGIGLKTTTEAELDAGGALSGSGDWERGQHIGSETVHVLAWLGPHSTDGGADESGYKFSWSMLREPVIDAVTGAGWTYKPKKI